MANEATLADLRLAARRKADEENSKFIDDEELDLYINESGSELHDIIVTSYQDYFRETATIPLANNVEEYDLPNDFYKELAIFFVQGDIRYRLERFMLNELTDYEEDRVVPIASGQYLRYRLVGNQLVFIPRPNGGSNIELWYVPVFTKLKFPTDKLTYAIIPGWEEFISNGAAIRIRAKNEKDAAPLMMRQAELKQRIMSSARTRDIHAPQRVSDVYYGRRNFPRRKVRY